MFGIKLNFASIAQLGLAAMTGGSSLFLSTALRTIGSQIAMNVIQRLGQQMGLPQPMIDMAQASFAMQTGQPGLARQNMREAVQGLADQFSLSPMEQGQLERAANDDADNMFEKLSEAFKSGKDMAEARRSRGSRAGASWLQVIADSMAKALDAKVQDMDSMAKALDKQGKNKSVKASTDLQVAGQEFSYLMNASSTVIKTIGEGLTGMARKQ
jgi:hypothetical protein